MARQFITGDVELEKTLAKLADKAADRVARSAIGAGLTVMKGAIKKAAPVGKTGMLKKSIGSRFQRASHGKPVVAKAGVNVGKKKKKEINTKRAPHAHLVALGTKARTRKRLGGKYASTVNGISDGKRICKICGILGTGPNGGKDERAGSKEAGARSRKGKTLKTSDTNPSD